MDSGEEDVLQLRTYFLEEEIPTEQTSLILCAMFSSSLNACSIFACESLPAYNEASFAG